MLFFAKSTGKFDLKAKNFERNVPYTSGLKAPGPEHELDQNSNRHVKVAQGKTMNLQPYTKQATKEF